MKAVLDRQERSVADAKFPLLAKYVASEKVVMFTTATRGFVVIGDGQHKVGELADWAQIENPDVWEILPGGTEVRLIQE